MLPRLAAPVHTAGLALICAATDAQAHGFAQRYDLPLPLWHYLAGAGATVALSFAAAALLVRPGGTTWLEARVDISHTLFWRLLASRAVAGTVRILSVAIFLLVLAAGFFGAQGEPLDNLLPVTVWIVWWVGLTYVCALVGDVWRLINPWAIVAQWVCAALRRLASPLTPRWASRAPRLGMWPAVVLFFAFCWAELVWPHNAVPPKLAWAIVLYSLLTWAGMAAFGIEEWLRRGEAFSRFFALVSRFAPLDRRGVLRPHGAGLVQAQAVTTSEMAFVLLALASVSFDGLKETPFWNDLSSALAGVLYRAGLLQALGNVGAAALIKTGGLALLPLLFLGVYLATCRCMATAVGRSPWTTGVMARHFVLSLVPIAIAYHLAHYLSYLLIQGQAILPLLSDPLNRGWDLFGTRGREPDLAVVDAGFVWSACVAAIVAGHVAAVLIAHVTALRLFGDARTAARSQYPLVALMVGYTMLSLWVLSQPIVEG